MCAAPKKNKFWKLRNKNGRDKLFPTPELLWNAACEYFQWCDDNPWTSKKEKTVNDRVIQTEETKMQRPYSMSGFSVYVGASVNWWNHLRTTCQEKEDNEFMEIITRIDDIIETQQFEGACVGAFNANIIARKLGLMDKQGIEHSGDVKTGLTVIVENKEDVEMLDRLKGK